MMKQNIPGIMIDAVKSGSGKTTVTCALLEALNARGQKPCAFKCGPDYIDPMFHREVLGVPSQNLDSFFAGEEQLRHIYTENLDQEGISVVEGVMGLYDGIGGIREEGSAYHVAAVLQLPILLVADVYGMGRSILPLLAGFLQYDKEKRIAGVILNKISKQFYQSIAPVIEEELHLPVLGFLPKNPVFALDSRYLGLKLPEEIEGLKQQIHRAAEMMEETVNVEKIIETASRAGGLHIQNHSAPPCAPAVKRRGAVRIGVARDEAFCFYYEANLKLLEKMGAELVFFSPLHEKELPCSLDGILLGGGYPELYAEQLERNITMKTSIRSAVETGMPSIAECGGFMYLHESLADAEGTLYRMCGILPGKCFYTGKLVHFGYIELAERTPLFLKDRSTIRGHEFHYYDSENYGESCTARKPVTGRSWSCVHSEKNHFWGFPHLYYLSNPGFAEHFIQEAERFRARKSKKADTAAWTDPF